MTPSGNEWIASSIVRLADVGFVTGLAPVSRFPSQRTVVGGVSGWVEHAARTEPHFVSSQNDALYELHLSPPSRRLPVAPLPPINPFPPAPAQRGVQYSPRSFVLLLFGRRRSKFTPHSCASSLSHLDALSGLVLTDVPSPSFSANGPETSRADQLRQASPSGPSLARCIRRDRCLIAECYPFSRAFPILEEAAFTARDRGLSFSFVTISISHHLPSSV